VANLNTAHYERLVMGALAFASGFAADPNLIQLDRVDSSDLVSHLPVLIVAIRRS
jgi:hypothetical protein